MGPVSALACCVTLGKPRPSLNPTFLSLKPQEWRLTSFLDIFQLLGWRTLFWSFPVTPQGLSISEHSPMDTFSVTKEQRTFLWGRIARLSQLRISLLGDPVPRGGGGFVSSWKKLKCICLPFRRSPAPRRSKAWPYCSVPGAKSIAGNRALLARGQSSGCAGVAVPDPRPVPSAMSRSLMPTAPITRALGRCPIPQGTSSVLEEVAVLSPSLGSALRNLGGGLRWRSWGEW